MKLYLRNIVLILLCSNIVNAQQMDLVVSTNDVGGKTYQARNSITFANGYSFTPAGGTLTAELVNPFFSGNISYSTNIVDPSTRSLNTNYLVGTPAGKFDVSAMGGGTYTIPVDIPPGIGGLQPNLSIVYNSQAGNGNAGYGWNISGLSAITRAGQDYYHDAKTTTVDLTANDRFYLDGQRLICPAGSSAYGTNNSVYRTEIDNFRQVTCYTGSYGPDKFQVKTKDGLTCEYGYNGYADQTVDGINETLGWLINKITDVYGNYIDFTYVKDNGVNYVAEINYGPNSINFYYKQRLDSTITYLKGKTVIDRLLLDKIEVKYNSTIIRKYEFKYNYALSNYGRYSVLNEVFEYGVNSGMMNSIVFKYLGTDNINYGTPALVADSYLSTNYNLYPGDFNGDGREDIFAVIKSDKKSWRLYLATENGGFSFSASGTTSYEIEFVIPTDLNGDGKCDILVEDFAFSGYSNSRVYYYWAISNGSSFGSLTNYGDFASSEWFYDPKYHYSSDFDGDGINDCLVKMKKGNPNPSNNQWFISSMRLESLGSTLYTKYNGVITSWGDKDFVGDFNGDAKTDIWVFDSNGINIYSVNGNSLTTLYSSTFPTSNHHFKMGDFNGDGKSDILVYGYLSYNSPEWKILIANDNNAFITNAIAAGKSDMQNDQVYTGDFNSDGKTDILALSESSPNNPIQYYFIAGANGRNFYRQVTQYSTFQKSSDFTLGDFNGNGKTDIIATSTTTGYYISRPGGNTNPLLSNIADGLNSKTEIIYQRLTDQLSTYTKGSTTETFPVYTYQGPLTVVKEVLENSEETGAYQYAYSGLKMHRQGKGVLGFKKMSVEELYLRTKTEKCFSFHPTLYYTKLDTVYTKVPGTTLSTTINTWAHHTPATNVIFPYISVSDQTDNQKQQSVKNTFTYNSANGNLTQSETDFLNGYKKTAKYHYDSNSTYNWIGGRLDTLTVVYSQTNQPSITRKTSYTYSTDGKLKPDFERYLEGTNRYYYKNNDYYSNGNIKQTFEYATNGGTGQTTSYTYETNGVRLKTVTDPLLHVTTNNYDTYGRLSSEVDFLGNRTGHKYDNLGRVVADTLFDGSIKTYTYTWGIGSFTNSCYNITAAGNDGSQVITWFDNKGREIRNDVKNFAGTYNYVATEYYPNGQLYRVSEPSSSLPLSYWNVYSYDAIGRPSSISRPTGRNTAFVYATNKVTETTGGKSSWKVTNSMGLVTTAHDNGGDIVYTYYPDGAVKTIAAGGGTTSMYYDVAGNQSKLVDPSAGTIEYVYDGFARMDTLKNGRGQKTAYNYMNDGRLSTVVAPEGTTTYAYYTNKMLQSVTAPGSVVTYYDYDAKGRVDSISENIAGSVFSTTFTFDNLGREISRKHPDGRIEKTSYNSYGYYLSTGPNSGNASYTVTAMNSYGQVTAASYGSMTGTFGYSTFGIPTNRRVKTGSTTYRQDDRYAFYPVTGNLTSRKDSITGRIKTESFTYDNLDRLSTITGPQNLTMQYNSNGNIERKNDLSPGVYTYHDSPRIYAVKEINSSNLLIPTISQSIATYTSFEQPLTITEGQYSATFTYNHQGQRVKMEVKQNGSTILTRWYVGSRYIKETAGSVTKEFVWMGGDAYNAPALEIKQNGTSNIYSLLRDHLGTITQVTGLTGALYNEYSYDAWGRRRNFTNWTYTVAAQTDLLPSRGFTGHEWLPWFNLYNMNGRLYDPLVGRFLSPDNYVQAPGYTQSFNRYSYALNNPLKYTDPDGENPLAFIIGAIIGAYLGGTASNDWKWNPGKWDYQNPATYFGIVGGGLAGGLGAQWMFGPGGVIAGGTPLNVSLGASFSNTGTAFANFSIGGGSGFTLQTLGYATVAGGGLYATGSTIKNFFKNDFIFENEFRIDYGVQAEVQGKLFGSKVGFSGEKETEPLVQLNYGYNEGLYGYGYSFDNPSYGYNGIKDPYRTSISGGFVFAGGEISYNPHRDLFKVGEKNSEEINAFLFNISKYYNSNGDILESQYYIGSGFDFSLFFGISYDFKIGFKRNNY